MAQQTQKPGVIVSLVRFLWDSLNFIRRFVLNAIVLLVIIAVVVAIATPGKSVQPDTALVLAPTGALVEQFSSDPVSRAIARLGGEDQPEVQLRDLVRAIDHATTDERIVRLVIRPERMTGAGAASLRELAEAIGRFKAAGKQVVAYADGLTQTQYYLAAQADEVYLDPDGMVLLEGYGRFRSYFREGLQDKLGVNVHLFRVGEFKSAAEPYILDGQSDEAREADLHYLNDLWRRYLDDIATARTLDAATLQAGIDGFAAAVAAHDGDLAQLALSQGLVDALKTAKEVRALLAERGAPDEDGDSYRALSHDEYLALRGPDALPFDTRPTVAVVVAQGAISSGARPQGEVGGDSTSELLRRALDDEHVKAVVLRVDSPGGEVFPSEQIRREVVALQDAGKPVVVSMANLAASGGYWISMNADRIIANPNTITGSIGIFGLLMTTPDTLAKIGVRVDGVGTTALAGAMDPRRPLSPELGRIIQSIIDKGYAEFIGKVADARERAVDEIDRVARGRVWSGAQALDLGLVDALGSLRDAQAAAAELAGLEADAYAVRYIEAELTPWQQFMQGGAQSHLVQQLAARSGLGAFVAQTGFEAVARDLDLLKPARGALPYKVMAHCLCEAD